MTPSEFKLQLIELILKDRDVREAFAIAARRSDLDRMLSFEADSSSRLLERVRGGVSSPDTPQGTPECSGGEDQ